MPQVVEPQIRPPGRVPRRVVHRVQRAGRHVAPRSPAAGNSSASRLAGTWSRQVILAPAASGAAGCPRPACRPRDLGSFTLRPAVAAAGPRRGGRGRRRSCTSMSERRSSASSPNRSAHHAASSTISRYRCGSAVTMASSSASDAGRICLARFALPGAADPARVRGDHLVGDGGVHDRAQQRVGVGAAASARSASLACHSRTAAGVISGHGTSPNAGRMNASSSPAYSSRVRSARSRPSGRFRLASHAGA